MINNGSSDPRSDFFMNFISNENVPVASFTSFNDETNHQETLSCFLCGTTAPTLNVYRLGMYQCNSCFDVSLKLKFIGMDKPQKSKGKKKRKKKG